MRKILKLNIFLLVEKIVRFLVDCGPQIRIALFTNMRIPKFRSQPTIALFAAVNHLNGPLRYGRPNGAKFKNSNSITFKDNDHIQRSHSHSRHEN